MRGARHLDECSGNTAKLKRLVILLRVAHRGTVVLAADDDQSWRRHITHEGQRGMLPVPLGVLPGELAEPVLRHISRDVGGKREATPVDHGLLSRSRPETMRPA